MFKISLLLKLKAGCEAEYEKRHDELWPDLANAMHQAGVSMVIYKHENDLFLFATASSKEAWDELERDPISIRWEEYMTDVLADDEDGKTIAKILPQMFSFGEFAEQELAVSPRR
jgi:L-rhamnose mutarotase